MCDSIQPNARGKECGAMAYPYYGNTYQPYNPYSNYMPTGPQNAAGAQQVFNGQIIRVNGKNGADALRLAPNSSVLLMDENDPIVWLKVTDGAGYATALPVDVNSLEERVKRLEDLINGKSDDANVDGKRGQKAE